MGKAFSRYENRVPLPEETMELISGWLQAHCTNALLSRQKMFVPIVSFGISVEFGSYPNPVVREDTGNFLLFSRRKRTLLVQNTVIGAFRVDAAYPAFQVQGKGIGNLVEHGIYSPCQAQLTVAAEIRAGSGILGIGGGIQRLYGNNGFGGMQCDQMSEAFVPARALPVETMKVVERVKALQENECVERRDCSTCVTEKS